MSTILATYPNDVRIVFKDFPITELHPLAQKAAIAGQCAFSQGKFWEMHDLIFAKQDTLVENDFINFASQLNLNTQSFSNCYNNVLTLPEVQDDIFEGQFKGVAATPTFFINGQKVEGAMPFATFQTIIEGILNPDTTSPTATATGTGSSLPTSTSTATPTTPPVGGGEPNSCGGTCGSNYNCKANLFCYQGFCRNPICASDANCDCVVATATAKVTAKSTTKPKKTSTSLPKGGNVTSSPSYKTLPTLSSKVTEEPEIEASTEPENKFFTKYALPIFAVFLLIVVSTIYFAVKKNKEKPNIPNITPPVNI